MLIVHHASTITLTATVTDSAGAAVTGATVTVTIEDKEGTALVTNASMTHSGSGAYDYTITNTLLPNAGQPYKAKITAVDGTNTRYAEVELRPVVDYD